MQSGASVARMRWPGARSIQRGVAVAALALSALSTRPAGAQAPATDEDLAAARRLFTDAVADEDAKRFDTALDKFRHVQAVKDTANVRYRIATCLEALGRRAEALASFQRAVKLGEGDRGSAEVVRASAERASQLDRVVPRLAIVLPPDAPPGTQVRVDDAPAEAAAPGEGVPLEPGAHTITATAAGYVPFRTGVTLPEGGRVSITVVLVPVAPPPSASAATSSPPVPTEPPPDTGSGGAPAGAWLAAGLGAALAAGSVVSFVLRQSNLNTINKYCAVTGGSASCPQSHQGEVQSAHDAAAVQGPLAIGLAVGAGVAAGAAVWLFVAPRSKGVTVSPVVSQQGGMLVVGGPFER